MSLLNSASLVVTPNGYKEGTLYSVIPNTSLGDMTVVRATTATRVNSAGLIELVPYNLVERSQEFNNGTYWGVSQSSISANATVAPDGTNTADKLIESNTNAIHEVYTNVPLSLTAGSTYTKTVFAKSAERTQVSLNFVTGSFGQGAGVIANLTTGTLGTVTNYGSVTGSTATITNVDNGWYRISITMTPASNANFYADFSPALSGNISYLGNGTSGIFIWGAQVVAGTLPKDYLRTETRLNIPRLDYSNGTCPSLLVEPQRTNIMTYSENASGSNWGTAFRVNATINQIASPDGNITANSIADTAVSGTHAFEPSFSATSGTAYTFSVFAKANTLSQVVIYGYADNGVFAGQQAIFNITNGTVISNTGGGTTNVVNYGNGYYRVSLTLTSGATSTGYWAFGLAKNGSASYLGNGSSLYMWGCQLESGSYPTSYIPTTSAAVTRNADAIYKTGISSLIGQTEGVFFLDMYYDGVSDNFVLMQTFQNASQFNVIQLYLNSPKRLVFDVGNDVSIMSPSALVAGRYKMAGAYKNNDFVLYLNGNLIGTDTSGAVIATDAITFNDYFALPSTYKKVMDINSAILFPTRLTNAELATLTTL